VVESGIENWSALFLQEELGASPATTGLVPGFFAVAMVIGRAAGQNLEGRLGVLGGAGISVAAPIAFGSAGRGADPGERGSAVASVTTVAYLGFLAGRR
jgi:hypothetical protein